MKTLIIFDSNQGNTQKIAEEIAKNISDAKSVSLANFDKSNLTEIKYLIVGSPIIGWKPTEKLSAFLSSLDPNSLSGVKATSFDTRVKLFIHGDAKMQIAEALKSLGAEIFTSPEHFYVNLNKEKTVLLPGELEKAAKWGKDINDRENS